ncbi:MAG TPA: Ig-like domain-containing protein [Verrucomicrobiae bacterium]|nr:Ig-like domain-containing protein [Verrucomicrobiae bacterium]
MVLEVITGIGLAAVVATLTKIIELKKTADENKKTLLEIERLRREKAESESRIIKPSEAEIAFFGSKQREIEGRLLSGRQFNRLLIPLFLVGSFMVAMAYVGLFEVHTLKSKLADDSQVRADLTNQLQAVNHQLVDLQNTNTSLAETNASLRNTAGELDALRSQFKQMEDQMTRRISELQDELKRSKQTNSVPPSAAITNGLDFGVESGTISAPFSLADFAISQPMNTGLSAGGKAVYSFTVTNSGDYLIYALVRAKNPFGNSVFVNIDGEPQEPDMLWEISPTQSNFEQQIVAWNQAYAADPGSNRVYSLSSGEHQLIIRGKSSLVALQHIWIRPVTKPLRIPSIAISSPTNGASYTDTAAITITANASFSSGSITNVSFYTNNVLAGFVTAPPYTITLSNLFIGYYTLKATATAAGLTGTSEPITIKVPLQPPSSLRLGL